MPGKLLNYITSKQHHVYRKECTVDFASEYSAKKLSPIERMSDRFIRLMSMEKPVILPDEKICFLRTVKNIPDCFTEEEWSDIRNKHFIHESGYLSNMSPNYGKLIEKGLLYFREEADEYGKSAIDAILDLADRYKKEAEKERHIKEAEGEAEAILKVQQANADGIRFLKEAGADQAVLTIKSLEAFERAADGKATKIIIPSELQGIAGLAKSVVEVAKED